jgi:hypothetical protein
VEQARLPARRGKLETCCQYLHFCTSKASKLSTYQKRAQRVRLFDEQRKVVERFLLQQQAALREKVQED